jgi:hypothetical protein
MTVGALSAVIITAPVKPNPRTLTIDRRALTNLNIHNLPLELYEDDTRPGRRKAAMLL